MHKFKKDWSEVNNNSVFTTKYSDRKIFVGTIIGESGEKNKSKEYKSFTKKSRGTDAESLLDGLNLPIEEGVQRKRVKQTY